MSFFGKNRVSELKAELKKCLVRRNYLIDSANADCGTTILKMLRPEIGILEDKANKILDELAHLDKGCPTFRYAV